MSDPHIDMARAARADALLRDELLVEAFDTLDKSYVGAWRETPIRDTEARERLWQAVQIVGKVRGHLTAIVGNGKLAQKELEEIEKLGERRKIFGI